MGEIAAESSSKNVILRRNRRGSKRANWASWPNQPFSEMESIHAAQMIIQLGFEKSCSLFEAIIDFILNKLLVIYHRTLCIATDTS